MPKLRRRLLALLFGFVLALVMGEIGIRVWKRLKHGTTGAVAPQTVHEASGLLIPTPGVQTGPMRINAQGFRNPEIPEVKPEGTIRLAFLGGSTTLCNEVSSDAMVWTHLVCDALRERFPAARFDYINGGNIAYTVSHSRKNLAHRIRPYTPDVIVIYHATNDLTSHARELAQADGLWHRSEFGFIERHSYLIHMIAKNIRYARRKSETGDSPRLEFDEKELSRGFQSELESLVREAQAVAPVVVLATFSIRIREEQDDEQRRKAAGTSLFYMPFMSTEGILRGFAEYNRVITEVARRTGALLVKGEETIPGDGEHFNDSVHFLDPGSRLQAQRFRAPLEVAVAGLLAR